MNIKHKIGERITASRKKLGLTIKELAQKTNGFSPARINNWELGNRQPGPEEAIVLADILEVSPGYLLCLSENPLGDAYLLSPMLPRFVPMLSLSTSDLSSSALHILLESLPPKTKNLEGTLTLSEAMRTLAGPLTFATIIEDESMSPDFNPGEVIIVDPNLTPKPGQYIIIRHQKIATPILRKYREKNLMISGEYEVELVPSNSDWPTLTLSADDVIIGTLIEHRKPLIRTFHAIYS